MGYRSHASNFIASTLPSLSIDKPAGAAAGDLLVAVVGARTESAQAWASPPSGWVQVNTAAGDGYSSSVFVKRAGASEPSSYTFSGSTSATRSGVIVCYENAGDPEDSDRSFTGDVVVAATPVVDVADTGTVLHIWVSRFLNVGYTLSAGPTERAFVDGDIDIVFADEWQEAPGTSPSRTLTLTSGDQFFHTFAVAVPPGNNPPLAPTIVNPAPGQTLVTNEPNRIDWDFNDPDDGDSQSAFDLQIREQGDTNLVVDVDFEETTNTYWDMAGDTLATGDYEVRVRTYDTVGEQGAWCDWVPFSAAPRPSAPTVTAPTSGGTISTEQFLVGWSAANQDAYQLRRVADDGGDPDTDVVYFDTGTIASSGARARTVEFETNNRWEHIQLRRRVDGLWSEWASVRVQVSYTVPATPTAAVAVHEDLIDGRMMPVGFAISATHPAPVDDEPAVTHMDVWRALDDGTGQPVPGSEEQLQRGTGLAPSATFIDASVRSGVGYLYAVRDHGDNGTSVMSSWAG